MAPLTGGALGIPDRARRSGGGTAAVATREAVVASPALGRWLTEAVEPLLRAGREGYAPTEAERRRLAALGTAALLVAGLLVVGPSVRRCWRSPGPGGSPGP